MLENQETRAHLGEVAKLGDFEPFIYEVMYSDVVPGAEGT